MDLDAVLLSEIAPSEVRKGCSFRAGPDDEQWFLDSRRDNRPTLTSQCWWELPPSADPQVLEVALREVVAGHDILSSRFEYRDDQVWCIPGEHPPEILRVTESGPEWASTGFVGGIDPLIDPLVRCLVGIGDTRSRFGIELSHATVDGWAWDLLVDELSQVYNRILAGNNVTLNRSPQLGDWADRQWRRIGNDDALIRRWADYLESAGIRPPDIEIDTSNHSGSLTWSVSMESWKTLQTVASRLRCTPTILLLGLLGWSAVWVHGDARAVRVPSLNRDLPGSTEIIGNLSSQLLVPFAGDGFHSVKAAVSCARSGLLSGADLSPMSFDRAARSLWSDEQVSQLHCWAPFLAVEAQTSSGDECGPAGGQVILECSPPDAQPGAEIAVVAGKQELLISANWRGMPLKEAQRFIDVAEQFVGRIERVDVSRHD
ncbi:hypothetical protein CH249_01380 [Rhodococcus sp. 05-2255-3B1]|uniref:condensation domain-containing protein n=1 Tax=unclassified Rhodococcus (in: high G+C Gram-positive bacteria) TaxID=192944 RepID=UPI000B9B315C|nr:hypothetical protein CH250_05985 [Rhodococcus sp. 05-2255-3C]OZE15935.1 hypothetical protein CH249_01380 [Rhodococcus sp. 05-2255-3B1]OZE18974.1 hypothetical protein CH255_13405 [Rhodococcus sp. 05-2255-2A2]